MTPEALLSLFLAEARTASAWTWSGERGRELAASQMILASPPSVRLRVALLAAEALVQPDGGSGRYDTAWSPALGYLVGLALDGGGDLDEQTVVALLAQARAWPAWDWLDVPPYDTVLNAVETWLDGEEPDDAVREALGGLRGRLAREGSWDLEQLQRLKRVTRMMGQVVDDGEDDPGEGQGDDSGEE